MTSNFDYPSTTQEHGFIDVYTRAGEKRSILVLSIEAFDELTPTQDDSDNADAMLEGKSEITEHRSTKEIVRQLVLKR